MAYVVLKIAMQFAKALLLAPAVVCMALAETVLISVALGIAFREIAQVHQLQPQTEPVGQIGVA